MDPKPRHLRAAVQPEAEAPASSRFRPFQLSLSSPSHLACIHKHLHQSSRRCCKPHPGKCASEGDRTKRVRRKSPGKVLPFPYAGRY
jgi:hypothetical protein